MKETIDSAIQDRLEYLRGEIRKECISYGEIVELQDLAEYIPEDDIVLREWAGVPEFEEDQPTTPDRIPAVRIEIERAEGLDSECYKSDHPTWEEAEERIRAICRTAPKNGGYDKTDFSVIFADGETYRGRYDATHPTADGFEGTLSHHICDSLLFYAGIRTPSHMTEEAHEELVRDSKEAAREWIKRYAVPGLENFRG